MVVVHKTTVRSLIRRALAEDAAAHDATSRAVIPKELRVRACIVAKARGVAAGINVAALTFTTVDPSIRYRLHVRSGAALVPGRSMLTVEGRARSIFAAERTALNLLAHLSGIATLTAAYVRRVQGTRAKIFDTRKTLPGLRALEKYAVRAGGGHNHRASLREAVLIKTNHLKVLRQETGDRRQVIQRAVAAARRRCRNVFLEIEVTNLSEFRTALQMRPDAILLDNMSLRNIKRAVRLRRNLSPVSRPLSPLLEVSGGVTLANVRAIARAGIDRISIGRLTHSAPSLDLSLVVSSDDR